jgi:hypothetical protein
MFEEPGTMDRAVKRATDWFALMVGKWDLRHDRHLPPIRQSP